MTATATEAPAGASLPNCGETCPIAMEAIGGETNDDRRLKLAVIAVTSGRATQTFAAQEWKVAQQRLSDAVRDHLAASDQVADSGNLITGDEPSAQGDQVTDSGNLITQPAPKARGKDGKSQPIVNYSEADKAAAVARVAAGESQRAVAEAIGCSQSALNGWVKKARSGAAPAAPSKPKAAPKGKAAPAAPPAPKAPPKPARYKTEVKRVERLLKVRSTLEILLAELELLARTRPGDGEGTLAHAQDWHQSVVAYIEQHEPGKAAELGVDVRDKRWLLAVMADLERLGHNCHGKVIAALVAQGYWNPHGKEPNSARYDWTRQVAD